MPEWLLMFYTFDVNGVAITVPMLPVAFLAGVLFAEFRRWVDKLICAYERKVGYRVH